MPKYNPQLLGKRKEHKTGEYRKIGDATSLSSVRVNLSTTSKPHEVVISDGDGIISRRLRRFGLALARYALPVSKYATKWKLPDYSVQTANAYIAGVAYRRAYGDDHTDGTYSPDPLINLLNQREIPVGALMEALSLVNTRHEAVILEAFRKYHGIAGDALDSAMEPLRADKWAYQYATSVHKNIGEAEDPQTTDRWVKRALRNSRRYHKELAHYFAQASNECKQIVERKGLQQSNDKEDMSDHDPHNDEPVSHRPWDNDSLSDGWQQLRVCKPQLLLPHSGKMGRRIIAWHTGRFPRYLSRIVTDPHKRIFSRKTRSLGAVVIIDCSGSMGLSQEDVKRLVHASAGASVLCYSSDGRNQSPYNAWLVARNGRQTSALPRFPGGNGVDGPALLWAAKNLRRNGSSPMIWISDGWVTGRGDGYRPYLREECRRIQKRYNIRRVNGVSEAIDYLSTQQRKGKAWIQKIN